MGPCAPFCLFFITIIYCNYFFRSISENIEKATLSFSLVTTTTQLLSEHRITTSKNNRILLR